MGVTGGQPPHPLAVLVVGGGGREHALAWACRRSPVVAAVHCAPGNGGTFAVATNHQVPATDADGLVGLARALAVDLVVLGPDAAVAAGVADRMAQAGIACFGPTAAAGRVESSKAFAKTVMAEAGIATAPFAVFDRFPAVRRHLAARSGPVVVKADGLALGKGAFVCEGPDEALAVARALLDEGRLGDAGRRIVVEDRLEGEEVSCFALCDGERAVMLPPAADYKRRLDGDRGPMTGGMGAVAPPPLPQWRAVNAEVLTAVVEPLLAALRRRGTPYRGCLYVGGMLVGGHLQVLEFNARFGDPEAEALLPILHDPVPALWRAATGALEAAGPEPTGASSVAVVVADAQYPQARAADRPIAVPADLPDGSLVFHMGTGIDAARRLCSSGGRILCCVGTGATAAEARSCAYRAVEHVEVPGGGWRGDIAAARGPLTPPPPLAREPERDPPCNPGG